MIEVKKISCIGTTIMFDQQCFNAIKYVCTQYCKSIIDRLSYRYPQIFTDIAHDISYQVAIHSGIRGSEIYTTYTQYLSNHTKDAYLSFTIFHVPPSLNQSKVNFHIWYKPTYDITNLTLNQIKF